MVNEIYDLCFSPNTTWVIKSTIIRRANHMAGMRERRGEERKITGRRSRGGKDNIKVSLRAGMGA
jgi:hypothetical protein